MSYNKKKKNQVQENKSWNWKLLPLQFVLCVLPLVLFLYNSNSGYSEYPWHSVADEYSDVFLHGKMIAFMIAAAITLGLAIYKTVKTEKELRKKNLLRFLPLFVYLIFVLLSTVCSEKFSFSVF